MKISARNDLEGVVTALEKGSINTVVDMELKNGGKVSATITNASVDRLGLKNGSPVRALIKASQILIGVGEMRTSARNQLCGKVVKLHEGPVNTEVTVEIAPGSQLVSMITGESVKRLELKEGGVACCFFKASSVLLAVE